MGERNEEEERIVDSLMAFYLAIVTSFFKKESETAAQWMVTNRRLT